MRAAFLVLLLLFSFCLPVRADREVPQVQVEAKIAEVNNSQARELGVNFDQEAKTDEAMRQVDTVHLPSAIKQNSAFGDDTGVQKFQAPLRPVIPTPALLPGTLKTPEDTPVSLQVVPKISADGKVSLDLKPETAVFPVNGLAQTPKVETPKIETPKGITLKRIPGSGTVAVGGLITDAETAGKKPESVPVLGKIPLVGQLFHPQNQNQEKKNLMVFITPTVVQPEDSK